MTDLPQGRPWRSPARCTSYYASVGGAAIAHRRANRFPATVAAANRGTSSKPARFICHWQRFADFPDDPLTALLETVP